MKKIISTTKAPAALGPYNQAILANDTLYISGQLPLNPANGEFVSQEIKAQTKQVMEHIQTILAEEGMTMSNIVKCSIFLKDMGDFAEMNEVYGTFFGEDAPARETVQVAKLPLDSRVEISAIAIK